MEEAEFSVVTCPMDVLGVIISYLPARAVVKLTATCRHLSRINCPALMRSIILRKNSRRIQPAMQKLALFTRLQTLVLHLQSENDNDIYDGLKYLTTLTQLQSFTFRASLNSLFAAEQFFKRLISLRSLDLQLPQMENPCLLGPLEHLSLLESLSISAHQLKELQFLTHLQKLKQLLLVSHHLGTKQLQKIFALTELTNLALVMKGHPKKKFYEQISALKSLQVFVVETGQFHSYDFGYDPLHYVCTSLPNLHTLIWNSTQLIEQIPPVVSKLEKLRVLRIRNNRVSKDVLMTLPNLEIQTDDSATFEALLRSAEEVRLELQTKYPNMTDEDLSNAVPTIMLVEKWRYS